MPALFAVNAHTLSGDYGAYVLQSTVCVCALTIGIDALDYIATMKSTVSGDDRDNGSLDGTQVEI